MGMFWRRRKQPTGPTSESAPHVSPQPAPRARDESDSTAWADLGPREDLTRDELLRRVNQPSPDPDTTTETPVDEPDD
jgi:hypothetical protein